MDSISKLMLLIPKLGGGRGRGDDKAMKGLIKPGDKMASLDAVFWDVTQRFQKMAARENNA